MKQFEESCLAQEIANSMSKQLSFETFLEKKASSNEFSQAVENLNEAIQLLTNLGQNDDADHLISILESLGK